VSRPPLLILGFLASLGLLNWTGALRLDPVKSAFIILSVGLANWGWTIYNELHDRKVDAINKPYKHLPSGQVDHYNVTLLFFFLIGLSLMSNIILTWKYGAVYIVGFLFHMTAFVYNSGRRDLLGNIFLGFTYGLFAFLSLYPDNLVFSLSFALLTLAGNIANQIQDLRAERAAGVLTLPQQLGKWGTWFFTEAVLSLSFVLFLKMFIETRGPHLLVFLAATAAIAFAACSSIWESKTEALVENLFRRLARLLLMMGFAIMLSS